MKTVLNSISPIDGRYWNKTKVLSKYFSEEALIRYRVLVEIEYFISLCGVLPQLEKIKEDKFIDLRRIYEEFSSEQANIIKDIEKTTNHDVKAVEYFIKDMFDLIGLSEFKEFIHFGLTSQDINNTAIPLSLKECFQDVYINYLNELINKLKDLSLEWENVPMLARTHGQPASPTRLGKEISVFVERLEIQLDQLSDIKFGAKFGGATGNYNAHHVAYPNINWKDFSTNFVECQLKLHHSFPTTQIEHYDHCANLFDSLKRINTIVIDLNRDIWTYISMNYFKQKLRSSEVGSSTMPHKINPIDFENSEGNLGLANAIFEHLSSKLPISRLQRDLTDSTLFRNIGVPFGHTIIAFSSTINGLNKLILNEDIINRDLEENWSVITEGIQTILRREGYPNPYELLKDLSRTNSVIDMKTIKDFIMKLDISEEVRCELMNINPRNYVGI